MGMTYSKIERSFWETDEARELTPEEKYFWMYLQRLWTRQATTRTRWRSCWTS